MSVVRVCHISDSSEMHPSLQFGVNEYTYEGIIHALFCRCLLVLGSCVQL